MQTNYSTITDSKVLLNKTNPHTHTMATNNVMLIIISYVKNDKIDIFFLLDIQGHLTSIFFGGTLATK